MQEKEVTKPYLHGFTEFIKKKLKLRPNYFTSNDYLYHIEGKDYKVGYNPRCQLLDFTPVEKGSSYHSEFSKWEYLKFVKQTKKFWEDCCLEFFYKQDNILTSSSSPDSMGFKVETVSILLI